MSVRKGTIIIGCKGYVSDDLFNGDWVTRLCSECGFNGITQCEEFRKGVKFTRMRNLQGE